MKKNGMAEIINLLELKTKADKKLKIKENLMQQKPRKTIYLFTHFFKVLYLFFS